MSRDAFRTYRPAPELVPLPRRSTKGQLWIDLTRPISCLGGVTQTNQRGAGEGNRTLVVSLGSFCSAIELHPRGTGILRHFVPCPAGHADAQGLRHARRRNQTAASEYALAPPPELLETLKHDLSSRPTHVHFEFEIHDGRTHVIPHDPARGRAARREQFPDQMTNVLHCVDLRGDRVIPPDA